MSELARFDRSVLPAPGEVATVEVRGRRVGLVWADGALHALADACPHRGAPLCSSGELVHRLDFDGERFTRGAAPTHLRCPWHRWEFDVRTGACPEAPDMRVRRFDVRVEDDAVVLSLG